MMAHCTIVIGDLYWHRNHKRPSAWSDLPPGFIRAEDRAWMSLMHQYKKKDLTQAVAGGPHAYRTIPKAFCAELPFSCPCRRFPLTAAIKCLSLFLDFRLFWISRIGHRAVHHDQGGGFVAYARAWRLRAWAACGEGLRSIAALALFRVRRRKRSCAA